MEALITFLNTAAGQDLVRALAVLLVAVGAYLQYLARAQVQSVRNLVDLHLMEHDRLEHKGVLPPSGEYGSFDP